MRKLLTRKLFMTQQNLDLTLPNFLLTKYRGEILPVPENKHPIPGKMEDLIPDIEQVMCDCTRFKFPEKVDLEEVVKILSEYYSAINWLNQISLSVDKKSVSGKVFPAETRRSLVVLAHYERDTEGRETDTLSVSLLVNVSLS